MSFALRAYVRGFDSQANGEMIVEALEQMGFEVKEVFDGDTDDNGGLIETHITSIDDLSLHGDPEAGDSERAEVGELIATIKRSVPSAFVQFDVWEEIGGDHSYPGHDSRFGTYMPDEDEEDNDHALRIVE